jgi:peptide-methionine (S)-S-oxide reductase
LTLLELDDLERDPTEMRKTILAVFLAGVAAVLGAATFLTAAGPGPAEKPAKPAAQGKLAKATFAGGCFWCMEPPFDQLEGVVSTTSGYIGGRVKDPTYRQVSSGGTGHAEAVEVVYDPSKIGYRELLEVFWRNIDPLVKDRQFCDKGDQYRTAIFFHDEEQRRLAEETRAAVAKRFDQPVQTEIVAATKFYPAEEYHQDYYEKNPVRYKLYRTGCGRDARLTELWGNG